MTIRWFLSLILGLLLMSLPAEAQTFEDGYQSYVRNQFPVAELQFKNALRKATADEDKAVLLKFIGICQYMRGDKKNAQTSFVSALNSDRSIAIESEDVLDPSVISFFVSIKSRMGPEIKKKPKPAPVAVSKPTFQTQTQSQAQNPSPKPKAKKKSAKVKGSESIMGLSDSNVVVDDKSRKLSFTQFLPFGFPQFHNDSYWLGGGVAALQVFTLYSMMDADKTIKDRSSLNGVVANKEGLTEEQRNAFYSENNAFIKKVKDQKNLALAGFGVIWIASITESIFFHKSPSNKNADMGSQAPIAQSLRPIFQASSQGATYGLSWQTELK
ncbi:MAG: hypothetical protein EOP07_06510 [Proteobacteria bacterium]|nr:MAG: hypothetical protein EOP07_06510 [Pseudomonadota bacterium]